MVVYLWLFTGVVAGFTSFIFASALLPRHLSCFVRHLYLAKPGGVWSELFFIGRLLRSAMGFLVLGLALSFFLTGCSLDLPFFRVSADGLVFVALRASVVIGPDASSRCRLCLLPHSYIYLRRCCGLLFIYFM